MTTGEEAATLATPAHPRSLWSIVGWRVGLAALAALLSACGSALGAVIAGRLSASPSIPLAADLALCLLGAVALSGLTAVAISGAAAHAEGFIRARLIARAMQQPLPLLDEQGTGELLDRIDDDPAQLATLARGPGLWAAQGVLSAVVGWIVAGVTWWPAWVLFPAVSVVAVIVVVRQAPGIAAKKVEEEIAWSDHSSQFEESVAARDDIRTSLGQPFVVRRYAELASRILTRVRATNAAATRVTAQVGVTLNVLVAVIAVAGVAGVAAGWLTVSDLVTLWMLILGFVGALGTVVGRLPDIQSGLGALQRIRGLSSSPQEPLDGGEVPHGPLEIELRNLSFRYPGGAGLDSISLRIPAGTTCALVGRTGSGKSTLAKMLSRALDPEPGTVFLGGSDVTAIDVDQLRTVVGVVSQRTEILAATLEQNVTLFMDVPRGRVLEIFDALGLTRWMSALPDGLDTRLGTDGVTLSAGEEQLVAFARLLVRDVRIVIMDEATARMDPQTARYVTEASIRLLRGRTGIIIAHRLASASHSDLVAVLESGRLVQQGNWSVLELEDGPFRTLLLASAHDGNASPPVGAALTGDKGDLLTRKAARGESVVPEVFHPPLARTVLRLIFASPRWGISGDLVWVVGTVLGAYGIVTGLLWGLLVSSLESGNTPWVTAILLAVGILISPIALAVAARTHPRWLTAITLRLRLAILRGQTDQRRLPGTSAGEVTARALDSVRITSYVDNWIGVGYGVLFAIITGVASGSVLAGALAGGVMVLSAVASSGGVRAVGTTGRQAGDARAGFGQALGSVLGAISTIKLAAATSTVLRHLEAIDGRRVEASLRENRIKNIFGTVPALLVQAGVVLSWLLFVDHVWSVATTLLLTTALGNFGWFGSVAGATVTSTPVARRWLDTAAGLAGGEDLASLPPGVDIVSGRAPLPEPASRVPLDQLKIEQLSVVHDDGTVGVEGVDLAIDAGEMVVILGRVGSGKSSLLAALAGLVNVEGVIRWNGSVVGDFQSFLRPGQVAYVAQIPRIVSGSIRDNIVLDHDRSAETAAAEAQLGPDLQGDGLARPVGHRGGRLSGGQVQRVALARALATGTELLIADDVSSALDARTEANIWTALRAKRRTTVASSSRRSTLAMADSIIVLEGGRVVDAGTWQELEKRWGHLAS
jgi:ATP-binding cassette, subfamily B, bacterial